MALIYHYCSPYTFQQIIERKKLWLSSTSNMNDFSEEKWFLDIIYNVLELYENELERPWCDVVRKGLEDNFRPSYITCFSKSKDLLSQWRAYAENGLGVAIGFESDEFALMMKKPIEIGGKPGERVVAQLELQDVIYLNPDILIEKVADYARGWKRLDNDALFDGLEGDMLRDAKAAFFSMNFERWAVQHKNPAFSEENEARLIYRPTYAKWVDPERPFMNLERKKEALLDAFDGLKYRISDGFLTSYFEYPFNSVAIKKVVLGPRNKFAESDLKDFLLLNDMRHVEIERSSATYR
ncbi:DUF2971 domain-containing protein [Serratia ureilytica]|uniref:DUF2971 domain-containing protein n=1 Tax=Serratia ureilytica TaxID=300181 RepID=UPI0018D77B36|nr:DUF2971 domain-containing protein [Serratia ureilytica]MBH3122457.1 DUF2971 domain-containing protein [Serratia ureilytica]